MLIPPFPAAYYLTCLLHWLLYNIKIKIRYVIFYVIRIKIDPQLNMYGRTFIRSLKWISLKDLVSNFQLGRPMLTRKKE